MQLKLVTAQASSIDLDHLFRTGGVMSGGNRDKSCSVSVSHARVIA